MSDSRPGDPSGRTYPCDGERILTIQQIKIEPGHEEEFIARFVELDVLGLAADVADGALTEASVVQNGTTFAVVTSWTSDRGLADWVASPSREKVREALGGFYVEPPTVVRYQLRASYTAPGTEAG